MKYKEKSTATAKPRKTWRKNWSRKRDCDRELWRLKKWKETCATMQDWI